MSRKAELLELLPTPYDRGPTAEILSLLLGQTGFALDDVDQVQERIARSRSVVLADRGGEIDELARLGAFFRLAPREGEGTEAFRRRLLRTVRLYLKGLGTAEAILRMAALFFEMEIARDPEGEEIFERPRAAEPLITRARLRHGKTEEHAVEVEDVPPQAFEAPWRPVVHGEDWWVENTSVFDAYPDIHLRCTESVVVAPLLSNLTARQVIGFRGRIEKDQILVLRQRRLGAGWRYQASLGGRDVTDRLFSLTGELFNQAAFDRAHYASAETPFQLLTGRNRLRYRVWQARFDWDHFGLSAYRQSSVGEFDESRFNGDIYALRPRANIRLLWRNHRPATFRLNLPITLYQRLPGAHRGLLPALNEIKAAGVRAVIGTKHWIKERDRQPMLVDGLKVRFAVGGQERMTMNEGGFGLARKAPVADGRLSMADRLTFAGAFDSTRFETSMYGE